MSGMCCATERTGGRMSGEVLYAERCVIHRISCSVRRMHLSPSVRRGRTSLKTHDPFYEYTEELKRFSCSIFVISL